jgi:hypothetical protein
MRAGIMRRNDSAAYTVTVKREQTQFGNTCPGAPVAS